jgi:hypothetical protein
MISARRPSSVSTSQPFAVTCIASPSIVTSWSAPTGTAMSWPSASVYCIEIVSGMASRTPPPSDSNRRDR